MEIKLPPLLQEMAIGVNESFRRMNKAREQITKWNEELLEANDQFESRQKEYHSVLNRWDPDTGDIRPRGLEIKE